MENRMMPVEIAVRLLVPSPFARPVDHVHVEALARSIKQIGLIAPITARAVAGGSLYEVQAGLHRLKAFRHLGRETIPAFVLEADDLSAELVMIDENLARLDLSPAERAAATARRKVVYELLHPETKLGGAGRGRGKVPQNDEPNSEAERFTKATATATGKSESTVQRDAARGTRLTPAELGDIAHTALDKGNEIDALAGLDPERRRALIARAVKGDRVSARAELKKQVRTGREATLGARQRALPQARYGVIYADPPWRFKPRSDETGMDRAADNHYPTLDLPELSSLDVLNLAADDAVLFLWATAPMLPEALALMKAWGFGYKSHAVWAKNRDGTGYWFRSAHELLLVGVRGSPPAPAPGHQWSSVFPGPVEAHSQKPPQARQLIEDYFPTLPRIELFARSAPEGWDVWGNEAGGSFPSRSAVPASSPLDEESSPDGAVAKSGSEPPAEPGAAVQPRLSGGVLAALRAAAVSPLARQRHGWANDALHGFQTNTIEALLKRGLVDLDPPLPLHKARRAVITARGRQILEAMPEPKGEAPRPADHSSPDYADASSGLPGEDPEPELPDCLRRVAGNALPAVGDVP